MRFVFASYVVSNQFKDPEAWIFRIRAYGGILENLSQTDEVFCIEQINYSGDYSKNGVNYRFLKLGNWARYFPFNLHQVINSLNPDIVFIQGLQSPLQVMLLRPQISRKVKILVQHHAEKPFTGIKKQLQKWADRYIDGYLFSSIDLANEWMQQGIIASPDRVHEVMEVSSIFHPIDKSTAQLKTGANGQPIFLWVGRLDVNKDPLLVVNAFLRYVQQVPDAKLYMIYGTDELLPEIIELLERHTDKDAVVLIGKQPNDDLLYWYNSADFIISASHYESGGTAVCEAMSCGCVPITSDIASFRTITNNGRCGFLYPVGDEDTLLHILLQSKHLNMSEMKSKCIQHFNDHLSFNAIAGRISSIAASL